MPLSLLDISNSLKNPDVCIKVPELEGGHAVTHNSNIVSSAGGYCVVYKYELANGTYKALRVWHKDLSLLPDLPEVAQKVSEKLTELNSPYFVDYKYHDKGILVKGQFFPVVVMDWCEGEDLKDFITSHIQSPHIIKDLAYQFKQMVEFFHNNNISHGDLQHGNIRINQNGKICVLDYDSMYVPALDGKVEYIKGLPAFQHPTAREKNVNLNPKVDYFSEYVIYLSLLLIAHDPSLWTEEIKKKDDILLFDIDDIKRINIPQSLLFKYRDVSDDKIDWIIKDLQTFLSEEDLNKFKPLEKLGLTFSFLPGDPNAHKNNPGNNQPKQKDTQISGVNVKALIAGLGAKGKSK